MPMGRENRPLFAWYGDMELVPHLWEALKAGPIDVVVEFHPPMSVDTAGGRKALAAAAEAIVRARPDPRAGGVIGRSGAGRRRGDLRKRPISQRRSLTGNRRTPLAMHTARHPA